MGSTAVAEKTEEQLRREIIELRRQQREITERLRDPRGIRRGGLSGSGPGNRGFVPGGNRQRNFANRNEENQPAPKRRLSSAVVKIEDGEIVDDDDVKDVGNKESAVEEKESIEVVEPSQNEKMNPTWPRRVGDQRPRMMDSEAPPVPRVLPKEEDPSIVKRNKRMLGQLLGTLERFRKEDAKISGTEAYMRRSDSLKRAEEKAREESEMLRQQEREQIAEKRRRDLTLRARVAAKAEEKELEVLFIRWSEHHSKLGKFLRTKAEPPIHYSFAKPLDEDVTSVEQRREKVNSYASYANFGLCVAFKAMPCIR